MLGAELTIMKRPANILTGKSAFMQNIKHLLADRNNGAEGLFEGTIRQKALVAQVDFLA